MKTKFCTQCKQEKKLTDFYYLKTGKYSYECKQCHHKYDKIYRATSEKNKEYRKQYAKSNYAKEYRRKYRKKNDAIKKKEDHLFALECNIRSFLCTSFKRKDYKKSKKLEQITGLAKADFIDYLIKTWQQKYNCKWNGQKCHIDHIIPLSTAKSEEDVTKLCYYTNLCLLTPEDNLKKSNKIYVLK